MAGLKRAAAPVAPGQPRLVGALRTCGVRDEAVLSAFSKVPRAEFVDMGLRNRSQENSVLPIGSSQTTSQPIVIATMIAMLRESGAPPRRVLEVGAGCGYQTAVLAELWEEVFAVERIRSLAALARKNLARLGYNNTRISHGDGKLGLPDEAPFDGIVVAAAADEIPEQLLAQLAPDARLVLPLADPKGGVRLTVASMDDGEIRLRRTTEVAFVPLLDGSA